MHHILIPGMACVVTAPVTGAPDFLQGAINEGYQLIYIIANNGDKYLRRSFGKGADGKECFSQFKVSEIPGFKIGEVKEENQFLPAGKIPRSLLAEVAKFFKSVMAKFGDKELEAMIWIMWNHEQGYFLHVPSQTVQGAHVSYDWGTLPKTSDGKTSRIIVDIHSHANFGAFFSSTDDNDDRQKVNFSGVLGHNKNPNPSMIFRFNFTETKRPTTVDDIFETPLPQVEDTPAEWLEKVQMNSYNSGNRGGVSNNGSHYGGNFHQSGYDLYHGRNRSYYGMPDPAKWKAPKPSNATALGWQGNQEGWFLEKQGFISLKDWEIDYERQCREEEEELAKKNGGQQGTLPLELSVRDAGQSSPSQMTLTGEPSVGKSESQKPSSSDKKSEKPNSSLIGIESKNNGSYESLAIPFPSARFPSSSLALENRSSSPSSQLRIQTAADQEFQVGPSRNLTTRATPECQQEASGEPKTEPEPARSGNVSEISDSTRTTTTISGSPEVFTELVNRPVAYISEEVDGYSVLRQVVVHPPKPVKAPTEDELDALHASYQQELRDEQTKLQSGSKAALLEDSAFQVPTLLKTAKPEEKRTSEVSPLGAGFQPTPTSAPVLQQRPLAPQLQPQVPTLIRKTVAQPTISRLEPIPGEDVEHWLDRRAAQIQRELSMMGRIPEPRPSPISESAIDRMHNRARQETLLETAEELAELQEGAAILFKKTVASGTVNVLPDDTVVLTLEKGDLPLTFDADVSDYGKTAAGAKAVIEVAAGELCNNESLMSKTIQSMFELVQEDCKLPLFRTLRHSLSSKARESLETNGF